MFSVFFSNPCLRNEFSISSLFNSLLILSLSNYSLTHILLSFFPLFPLFYITQFCFSATSALLVDFKPGLNVTISSRPLQSTLCYIVLLSARKDPNRFHLMLTTVRTNHVSPIIIIYHHPYLLYIEP